MSNTKLQTQNQNQRKEGEDNMKISILTGNPIKMRIELPFPVAVLKEVNDEVLTLRDAQDNPIFKIIVNNTANKLEQYALILKDTDVAEVKFTLENEFETEMEALKAALTLKEKTSEIFKQVQTYLEKLEKIKEEIQYV